MRTPMVSKKTLAAQYNLSPSTIDRRLDELEEEISRHRYPATALIRGSGAVRVDPEVFADYLVNRKRIKSGIKKRIILKAIGG